MSDKILQRDDDMSAVRLRDLRRRVQQTAGLVAVNGTVYERPGACWAADPDTRVIEWRPTLPFPPYGLWTDDEVLCLIAHEASHLNWSGRYHVDGLKPDQVERFHRFVNAVEDIRVDRMSMQVFPGFAPLHEALDKRAFEALKQAHVPQWALADQVGMDLIGMSHGWKPQLGNTQCTEICSRIWKHIDRIANVSSTQEVATALLPIFLAIEALDTTPQLPPDESGSGGSSTGPSTGDAGGAGGSSDSTEKGDQPGSGSSKVEDAAKDASDKHGTDKPSNAPERSDGDEGTEPLSDAERISGVKKDAKGEDAKDALERFEQKEAEAQENAADQAQMATGETGSTNAPGGRGGYSSRVSKTQGRANWETHAARRKSEINLLYRKLRSVLKTNAADNYTEGLRRGQLNPSRLPRAMANNNPRIFRKRKAMGEIDYTFGIIIDRSGSMSGKRLSSAFDATVLIAEALEKAGLGVFIVAWDDYPNAVKRVDRKLGVGSPEIGAQLSAAGGGTYEAPALVIAQEQFNKVRSGEKMLFTITDGQTTNRGESQQLIRELQDAGVKCVAIGIGFKPASHYDVKLEVQDAAELPNVLPKFINSIVRKRGGM